ncbi:MAG: UDP-N-acetylglucosamine 2-epimerase (non-hydrolyzing) [Syntrophobacteraceae bacterium]|nr:UDP-N-acetylglucosamine 2-epimerase (non-hydrolyzing) [Syntrophobacteraceae bacterium]
MKILSVVGARPNFMKISPIISAIDAYNAGSFTLSPSPGREKIDHFLVHTGQHYDRIMSESFFQDLGICQPDASLGVGSGTHAGQTAEILRRFEPVLLEERPDLVLVAGDVNSTLACALVAAKISYGSNGKRPLIAHVEAGLRSFDRTMPEEVNRVATDHLCDLLFVTEQSGIENLKREGIPEEKIFFVGNTMIDTLMLFRERASQSDVLKSLGLIERSNGSERISPYALLTLHRPSNVDNRETFTGILDAMEKISARLPVVFPAHPRTRKQMDSLQIQNVSRSSGPGAMVTEPLGYIDFLCLMSNAKLVLTDSGGIQEETTCLGVPCVTIRENTERPVTVTQGTNLLSGVKPDAIVDAANRQLARQKGNSAPEFWDGRASYRIVEAIRGRFP